MGVRYRLNASPEYPIPLPAKASWNGGVRPRASRGLSVLIALAFVLTSPPAGAPSAAAAPSTPPAGLLAIERGDAAFATTHDFRYVVLNAWDDARIRKIRAADPGVQIFVYKDMSSTRSYACHDGTDDRLLPTGIGFCWAKRHHPGWFLHDQDGDRIEWQGYPDHWWMDVGRRGYERIWASNVIADLRRYGWDGVMVDNAIVDPTYYLEPGASIPKYPTVRRYRQATARFLRSVGPRIRSAGFGVVPNIGGGDASPRLLARWARHTTGFQREHWSRFGSDGAPLGGWNWTRQMSQMDAIESRHKTWFAVTRGSSSETELMRYAEASFLLAWNGRSGALFYRPEQGTDAWSDAWTENVGSPLDARFAVGAAWRRDFSGGVVVVNPSDASVTVALGATYTLPDGTQVDSVTLAPTTAEILRST
jgi:Hypothetical glycosyl hydrolase family 15